MELYIHLNKLDSRRECRVLERRPLQMALMTECVGGVGMPLMPPHQCRAPDQIRGDGNGNDEVYTGPQQ